MTGQSTSNRSATVPAEHGASKAGDRRTIKVIGIIQARMGSTRLPGKVLADIEGEPMVARVVQRLSRARLLNAVVVATSTSSLDNAIEALCLERKWPYYRGSEHDVLDRYYQAALRFGADAVVRVTADCPLISPLVVDRTIEEFLANQPGVDYVSNFIPRRTFPRGVDVEVIHFDALKRCWIEDKNPALREHVTPYIYLNPHLFRLHGVTNTQNLSALRWTVDSREDLELTRTIYRHFGHDRFTWMDVVHALSQHPEWELLNRHVQQKPIRNVMVLGTAQFGMPYGIANVTGQPAIKQAADMVAQCWEQGIRYFDTAQAYGDSELVLGTCLESLVLDEEPRIITKLHPGTDIRSPKDITKSVQASIGRLRVSALWGLMLHREHWLDEWDGVLGQTLRHLKNQGLIRRLGASVYSVERALQAVDKQDLDVLQVPINVFDRRMARANVFEQADRAGKQVFARSIYLQGLALMDPAAAPDGICHAKTALTAFAEFCRSHQLDRKRFAVEYVRHRAPKALLVLGAETSQQALENCALTETMTTPSAMVDAWDAAWPEDLAELIDPSRWKTSLP
jgi:spore coat polysaccharide biosynthesis protein SpsF